MLVAYTSYNYNNNNMVVYNIYRHFGFAKAVQLFYVSQLKKYTSLWVLTETPIPF